VFVLILLFLLILKLYALDQLKKQEITCISTKCLGRNDVYNVVTNVWLILWKLCIARRPRRL